jgi:hypothetical protein
MATSGWVIAALLIIIAACMVVLQLALSELRRQHRWRYPPPYPPYWVGASPLREMIAVAQTEVGVTLTWGAREMLIIPIVEAFESRGQVDWNEVQGSIRILMETLAEEGQLRSLAPAERLRSAVDVIRAFYKRFCNIPPFCSRKEG